MSSRDILRKIYNFYLRCWLTTTGNHPIGRNIFEKEWDLLIILDACRVDTLKSVADEYPFLQDIDHIWSVGSTSDEWLAKTFTNDYLDEIPNTAYVTSNPHTERVLNSTEKINHPGGHLLFGEWGTVSKSDFELLDEVWKYGWIDGSAVPPRTMTDRAISVYREQEPEQMIVHYLQPHRPYLDAGPEVRNTWEKLYNGELSVEKARDAYEDNLRLVLEDVSLLLSNIDAEQAVITADHGEAFGELTKYGHGAGFPHPAVKRVPWVETEACDDRTYEVQDSHVPEGGEDLDSSEQAEEDSLVEDRLRDLGYL